MLQGADMQAKLGSALFNSLIKLRQQKGTFSMEDVGALFMQISATFQPPENEVERSLKREIEQLAEFIEQAKDEIYSITASRDGENATSATLHLGAVLKATEEAGHNIMDAADAISAAVNGVGGERQKAIEGAVTKIYEACNFQDLTGQRLDKVIKMLGEIDSRINHMMQIFGGNAAAAGRSKPKDSRATEEEKLLSGPQFPDQAPSQADIDTLFAGKKP